MAFFEFPHTRTYDSDLGWIIKAIKDVETKLDQYLENSVITFADPITWDITEQYTALTCVIDSDGTAYLSKQPVPAGVDISNTDYWEPIFNYDDSINRLMSTIAANERNSHTATAPRAEGDLVYIEGVLYKVLYDIAAGTAYIEGVNISEYTVSERIKDFISGEQHLQDQIDALQGDLTTETADREAADNAILLQIGTLSGSFIADRMFRIVDNYDGTDHSVGGQGITATNTSFLLGGKISGSDDSKQRISEYTMTGDFIRSHDYTGYTNHLNGIAYDESNNKIYATGYGSQIVVIDYTTLNVEGYLTTELDLVCGIDVYDGKLYVYGYYNDPYLTRNEFLVAEVDKQTAVINVLTTFILPPGNPEHIFQDMAVYSNYAYIVLSQASQMMRINLETGETDTPIIIGEGNGFLPYGECESAVFINGQMYMTSTLFGPSPYGWVIQVWKTNQGGDVTVHGLNGQSIFPQYEVKISKAITNKNPDGSGDYPFNTATELSAFVNYFTRVNGGVSQVTFLDGAYPNERLTLTDCSVGIRMSSSSIDRIALHNGIYALNGGTSTLVSTKNAYCTISAHTTTGIDAFLSTLSLAGVTYTSITATITLVSGKPVVITPAAGVTIGNIRAWETREAVHVTGYINLANALPAGDLMTLSIHPPAVTYFPMSLNGAGTTRYAYVRTNGTVGHDSSFEAGMWLFSFSYQG